MSGNSRRAGPRRIWLAYVLLGTLWLSIYVTSANKVPVNPDDICSIFEDKRSWYRSAKNSEQRWGTPKHVQMSIIRQESSFRFNARPPRTKVLGVIPWKRPSNAYGYAQALDSTWAQYKTDTGRLKASRDDFDDAIDFVGWYTNRSNKSEGISKWDPYNQYLAYHEGQQGWRRGTYQGKEWLKKVAQRVDARAKQWGSQLQSCEDDLHSGWWITNN